MTHLAIEVPDKAVSEVLNAAVSFSGKLETGEKLVGTPVIVEETSSDLTIDNEAVSVALLNISGVDTPIGEAAQFRVSGGVAGQLYTVNISCTTDATPAQTLLGKITFNVEAD